MPSSARTSSGCGAGALAFDSGRAAFKGLGLAAGTAGAFGGIWSPSTTATLNLGGGEAMNCIDYNSERVEVALSMGALYTAKAIEQLMVVGNGDLAAAQQHAAPSPPDADLPTLTVAIQGWNAAVKVATTALPVATDPVGYLLGERSAIVNKMLAKLNRNPISISARQETIQGCVSGTQAGVNSSMASAAVLAVPGGAQPGYMFDSERRMVEPGRIPSSHTAEEPDARLAGDTKGLFVVTQWYATAAGNIATCSGDVPSSWIRDREPMLECIIVPLSAVAI